MPRYRIIVEYDGTPFAGWQIQPNLPTVQGVLAEAIRGFSQEIVVVKGAGRTDAGVHATGQVAHFDLTKDWPAHRVREAMNYYLRDVAACVLTCEHVADTFDARFSATQRHYRYRLLTRRARPALARNRVWWIDHALDADAMGEAARVLLGRHDFTTFRAAMCQAKSPVRTLDVLDVAQEGEEICVTASARSFLHNQVRSMVGSLKLVGEGKWTARDMQQALEARDRAFCGPVAPPTGLYLTRVDYES